MGTWFSKSKNDGAAAHNNDPTQSAVLHRDVTKVPPLIISHHNNYLRLDAGWDVYDASGGAAVSNLGHGYKDRIWTAMTNVYFNVADYLPALSWATQIQENLAQALIATTKNRLVKAIFYNSGKSLFESSVPAIQRLIDFRV